MVKQDTNPQAASAPPAIKRQTAKVRKTMRRIKKTLRPGLFALGLALTLGASGAARAQDGDSYAVGDEGTRPAQTTPADPADAPAINENADANAQAQGPVRLARFAYIQGNVTWREDESAAWADAGVNLPVRQGAQIFVAAHGRAEIQFDDGSLLRLGSGALVTLQTLYSDTEGEFTEIKLTEGLASLRTRNDRSVYQIDTPYVSVKTNGPSKLRIGAGETVEAAVTQGDATVEGSQGRADLHQGDYLSLDNPDAAFAIRRLPRADSWERWNEERDAYLEEASDRPSSRHLPANIALVAPDLDAYGSWRDDPDYGYVWCPRVVEADWRPYNAGRWTWVQPFGWTWVSSEAWGWAPYHYGTWAHRNYGWAWCPGPVTQYWSPAVVHFSEYSGGVAWCALAPREVRYPASLSIGFGGGNWGAFFSIGQAAVYYPTGGRYCEARPWDSGYINHIRYNSVTNINNVTNVTNIYNNNRYVTNNNIVRNVAFAPINAQNANGASSASLAAFGGRGAYRTVSRSEASVFTEGRAVTAPRAGQRPVAGPVIARPSAFSTSPTRTLTPGASPSNIVADRSVFRAPLPQSVQRSAGNSPLSGRATQSNPNGGFAGRATPTNRTQGYTGNAGTSGNGATGNVRGGYSGNAGGNVRGGSTGTTNGNVRGGYTRTPGSNGVRGGYTGNSSGVTRTPNRSNPNAGTGATPPRRDNPAYGNRSAGGAGYGNAPTPGRTTQPNNAPRSYGNGNGNGTTSNSAAADRARAARQSLGVGRSYGGPNGTYRQDPSVGRRSENPTAGRRSENAAGQSGSGAQSAPRPGYMRPNNSAPASGNNGRGSETSRPAPRRETASPRSEEPTRSQPAPRPYNPPARTQEPPARRDPAPTRSEPRQERRAEPSHSAPAHQSSGGGESKGSSGKSGDSKNGGKR